jgi:hypothetical protein
MIGNETFVSSHFPGFSLLFFFNRERELSTTDHDYVKWTQWIFLQMFKKGLAFQNEAIVNWCPALGKREYIASSHCTLL